MSTIVILPTVARLTVRMEMISRWETMSDFSNFLPLSQRRAFDESRVSGDWRPVTGQCLAILIAFLDGRSASDWNAPSLRPGWTVREVVADLVWRAESSPLELAVERFRAVFRDPLVPDREVVSLARESPHLLVDRMRRLATLRDGHRGRRGVGDLSDVVSRALEISRALDHDLELPAIATGAVCLARVLTAPLPIRAAIAGRSLEAEDAGWTVGRGPALLASAEQHVLFLFGRSSRVPGT